MHNDSGLPPCRVQEADGDVGECSRHQMSRRHIQLTACRMALHNLSWVYPRSPPRLGKALSSLCSHQIHKTVNSDDILWVTHPLRLRGMSAGGCRSWVARKRAGLHGDAARESGNIYKSMHC